MVFVDYGEERIETHQVTGFFPITLHFLTWTSQGLLYSNSCYLLFFAKGKRNSLRTKIAYDVRSQCLQVSDRSPDTSVSKFMFCISLKKFDIKGRLRLPFMKYLFGMAKGIENWRYCFTDDVSVENSRLHRQIKYNVPTFAGLLRIQNGVCSSVYLWP